MIRIFMILVCSVYWRNISEIKHEFGAPNPSLPPPSFNVFQCTESTFCFNVVFAYMYYLLYFMISIIQYQGV